MNGIDEKWMNRGRISEIKWNEWFEGFDLEPLQSDLSELCGNLPMSWEWVSLWKWLEMSDLIKPYQNEWNRWEMNELRWIEWNEWIEGFDFVNPMARSLWSEQGVPMEVTWDEWFDQTLSKWMESMRNEWIEVNRVKWVNWRIWLCEPYGKIPMVRTRCPYESDLRWVIWSNPIKMIRFNEKWMKWSEMSEMKWNEWFDGNDLEQPYGNGPMSRLRVSLWKWLDVSDLIKPFQNDQNRWEMNELKWIEWIEWNEWFDGFDFVNPMGKSLWVENECPYESDLRWVIWSNPIKMIRIDEKWMKWSE